MNDNFDLRKFLVESKAIENMNPIFRKLNENKENTTVEPINENILRAKIREMVLNELALTEDTIDEAKKKEEDTEDMPTDETEDINIESDPEPATPEDELSMAAAGATGDSKEMIDHLMKALDNAKTSGNEKLVTQVLNTLKFAIDQSIVD
jgi:hypothetical protein